MARFRTVMLPAPQLNLDQGTQRFNSDITKPSTAGRPLSTRMRSPATPLHTMRFHRLLALIGLSHLLTPANADISLSNADFSSFGTPPPGWTVISGNAQAWSNNGTLVGTASAAPWEVRQVSNDSLEAHTQYQFSAQLGCNTSSANGSGTWTATLGTWNGSSFTPINGASQTWNLSRNGGNLSFTAGSAETKTFQFTTGATPPTDPVAVQLSVDASLAWMAMDNVSITTVVPSLIANPSFEDAPGGGTPSNFLNAPPEGWTRSLSAGTEAVYYNGAVSDQSWSYAFGPGTTGHIAQISQVTIEEGTEYTILCDLARNSSSGTADFVIEAWIDGSQVDAVSSELKHQNFLSYALHLTTGQLAPHIGKNLEIRVGRSGGDNWLGIDNLRVQTRDQNTLEFMILGDSITQGRNNGKYSYRYPLWKHLVDLGIDFDMVGSHDFTFQGPTAASNFPDYQGKTFDRDNEGHWNWDADQVLNGYSESSLTSYSPNPSTGTENLSVWLKGYQADYVLIALGRNDCNRNQGATNYATRMGLIIDALQADNPDVTIFLASVLDADKGGDETSYNAQLPDLATNKTTSRSRVIHAEIGKISGLPPFDATTHTYDQVHPNTAGEQIVADHWNAVLGPYLTPVNINVTPPNPHASELDNQSGVFRLELPNNHKSRTISYQLGGTANQTSDYTLSATTITIPANTTSVDITATPLSDALAEGTETITFTALPGDGYTTADSTTADSTNSASISIADHPVEQAKIDTFGNPANANLPQAADDADWDQDGTSNLLELALGTAADNPSDTPTLASSSNGSQAVFSYSTSTDELGLTVTPYYSHTLQPLSWNPVPTVNLIETSDGKHQYQAMLPNPGERAFFRLDASR